ncbi:MAG: hypothetical protein JO013_08365 [Alphaproteobacteria bacterium]|nr:hypothetical protein [Alphaproteobacteria bacterium]
MRRALLTLPLLMLPSACLLGEPGDRIVYSPCHALATGGWRASVARISVTQQKAPLHRTFLFVEGEVTAPESDTVSLDRGPVQHLAGTVQQIFVRTDGPGTGRPVVQHVQGRFRALKHYGSVAIRCGDGIVGTIRDIPRRDQ